MPNGIKKLSYPAYGTGGIDPRLGMAHEHSNILKPDGSADNQASVELLDQITSDTLDKIAKSALADLTNIDVNQLGKIISDNKLAVIDVSDNKYYVRQNGKWVELTIAHPYPTVTTSDTKKLTIKGSGTDTIKIDLSNEFVQQINDIQSGKLNKLPNVKDNNLIVADGSGNIKDSGISAGSVILSDNLAQSVTSPTDNSEKIAMSALAGYNLYKEVAALKRGLGKPRGTVANAFVSKNSGKCVQGASVISGNGGKGYKEGSIAYITTNTDQTIVPALVAINKVNADGSLKVNDAGVVTVLESGIFASSVTDISYLIPCESDTDNYAKLSVYYANTAYTTLRSIELPVDGDTAYVMKDETDNNSRAIYMYRVPQSNNDDGMGSWVKVTSFDPGDSRYILRYE